MIKLLAVDMDGTCLDSEGRMSEETVCALKKAAESGVIVVPTTGRNATCLPDMLKKENFYHYIISSNGSLVLERETGREIFTAYIENETAVKIAKKFSRLPVLLGAHANREFYVQGWILYFGVKHFFKNDDIIINRVRSMAKALKNRELKVEEFQLFYKGRKFGDTVKKIISPYVGIVSASSEKYSEVYNAKGTKGTALLALAKELGIDASEIACIVDEENDISMFDIAGVGLAMGNAIDEIKKRAKYILPSNDEKGVVYAVENYILK